MLQFLRKLCKCPLELEENVKLLNSIIMFLGLLYLGYGVCVMWNSVDNKLIPTNYDCSIITIICVLHNGRDHYCSTYAACCKKPSDRKGLSNESVQGVQSRSADEPSFDRIKSETIHGSVGRLWICYPIMSQISSIGKRFSDHAGQYNSSIPWVTSLGDRSKRRGLPSSPEIIRKNTRIVTEILTVRMKRECRQAADYEEMFNDDRSVEEFFVKKEVARRVLNNELPDYYFSV
ncbi:hypothetical protein TNIN_248581 [Trichonephila inaurata madagascariensis]|uniref:Uncharacterized protein n=1 Tax=Trichonephila inaurata madagascariensis TaxID=2747483 RepID=A0A8X6XLN2_9ARAC|nr:hypothetical protein TNIN_248581 [Trichonephila inaurata madagascariensis]